MKQLLDSAQTLGRNTSVSHRVSSVPRCRTTTATPQTPEQIPKPATEASIWGGIIALLVVIVAAGYLFWAKITGAWPFP